MHTDESHVIYQSRPQNTHTNPEDLVVRCHGKPCVNYANCIKPQNITTRLQI